MTIISLVSCADLAKAAVTMARLLVVCSCSFMAAPLTAPLKFMRISSKLPSVMLSCKCVHSWLHTELTFLLRLNTCIDTHNIDGGERSTERGVHTLPHTRRATGPVDYGKGGGAADRVGGASRSIWPEEKLCGLCFTESGSYRYMGTVFMWKNSICKLQGEIDPTRST